MLTTGQLASMRATSIGSLPDTCTIAPPGVSTFDPSTGTYSDAPGTSIYQGPCRVSPQGRADIVVQAGEEPVTQRTYDVTLPWDVTGVKVDHRLIVTASSDPGLVGRSLRVRDVRYGSNVLARRLVVEDDLG